MPDTKQDQDARLIAMHRGVGDIATRQGYCVRDDRQQRDSRAS